MQTAKIVLKSFAATVTERSKLIHGMRRQRNSKYVSE